MLGCLTSSVVLFWEAMTSLGGRVELIKVEH